MKLFPKKEDIDKAKAQERKMEIDAGLALATKIDVIRETKLREEKDLREWRESTIAAAKYEIGQYVEERENLKVQCDDARELRNRLLEPLDSEWNIINNEKSMLSDEKSRVRSLWALVEGVFDKCTEVIRLLSSITRNLQKEKAAADKAYDKSIALRQAAQAEYDHARNERIMHADSYEKSMERVKGLTIQYEVGIQTNERDAQRLREKESDLITREKHLETQQIALRIAKQEIDKK